MSSLAGACCSTAKMACCGRQLRHRSTNQSIKQPFQQYKNLFTFSRHADERAAMQAVPDAPQPPARPIVKKEKEKNRKKFYAFWHYVGCFSQ
jgi:hypothetical protein